MQPVRRSLRLRNQFQIAQQNRGTASEPDLRNMGGDRFNNLNNRIIGNAALNPDINDLLPMNQAQGDFDDEEEEEEEEDTTENKCTLLLTKCLKVFAFAIIVTLALNQLSYYQNEYNYSTINYNALKQINIIKQNIRIVKRELMTLNKGIQKLLQSRRNMTTKTIGRKYDTLLEERFMNEIEKALTLYDADKVGMIDYALESAGGLITSTPDTVSFPTHHSYQVFGLITVPYPSNPQLLLQPSNLPGQCYAFNGDKGKIRIRLTHLIQIAAVTIEHTPPNLVQNRYSAPKDFEVYGLETARDENKYKLGTFTYKLNNKPIQTFYVEKTNKAFEHVELNIVTNHGNPTFTCVYRFRVHGKIVSAPNRSFLYY